MADLERYRQKRRFDKTPEPEGAPLAAEAGAQLRLYVIQKHAARQLHYDLRLEFGGVLLSWAVPKGPTLDPSQKRLAVHVEDHPVDYATFEGTIPTGEYGAGTVMVWDRGQWEALGDPEAGLAKGHLRFALHGEKLRGRFDLVRMRLRDESPRAENWLLIKVDDEAARALAEYDVLEARPESVASGRDLAQIATGEPIAAGPAPEPAGRGAAAPAGKRAPGEAAPPARATRAPLPLDAPMQLATLVERPPEGPDWIHEVKYDGYRLRLFLDEGASRLITRTGQDWTDRFPELAEAAKALPASSAMVDGEAVVYGPNGVPDFGALQNAVAKKHTARVAYMAFDLLYLDGWDLRDVPLLERKDLLRALVAAVPHHSPIRYAEHISGHGPEFHREACTLALEGSVAKRGDRTYREGRTRDWQKVKCLQRQEFVVGGFTKGEGSRAGFGALLLGFHDPEGELVYAGRVGTGFSQRDLADLRARLDAIETGESPFRGGPEVQSGPAIHWVRPEVVAEVSFQEWTREGVIRQPVFLGLRADKPAEEVVREEPGAPTEGGAAEGATAEGATAPTAGAAGSSREIVAGVTVTKPDKPLYAPSATSLGVTKRDLARYYESVAEQMLPYAGMRLLTLLRCPHGHESDCFYQKHPEQVGFPKALKTMEVMDRDGMATYAYADDAAGLVSLAQLGVLEIHTWQSTVHDAEHPDQIVFDLDPGPGVPWDQVAQSAATVRDALGALGLTAFAKATGGKGLHLVVPIVPDADFDEVRGLAHAFVERIAADDPRSFTAKMAKVSRPSRVFLDYLRNAHGATAIAPYSTRARPGAPVATPIAWEEVANAGGPPTFDITSVLARLASLGRDPWEDYENARAPLADAVFAALGSPRQRRLDL